MFIVAVGSEVLVFDWWKRPHSDRVHDIHIFFNREFSHPDRSIEAQSAGVLSFWMVTVRSEYLVFNWCKAQGHPEFRISKVEPGCWLLIRVCKCIGLIVFKSNR
jgi:hypothetical protein